jgi:hypothetical protein
VHVVVGMALALLGAETADLATRRHLSARTRGDVLRLSREDVSGGIADVGTVQAEAYAPAQVGHVVLGQIGIGAGGAALRTRKALIDAAGQDVAVDLSRRRMCLQYFLRQSCGGHGFPFLSQIPAITHLT